MALPSRPPGGLPSAAPVQRPAAPAQGAPRQAQRPVEPRPRQIPPLEEVAPSRPRQEAPARAPQRRQAPAPAAAPVPRAEDDKYEVDPTTGKRYKLIPGVTKAAIAAHKRSKNGLSKEELLKYSELDEDFDIDDLTNTADLFLAHLRVPPSKEEQEKLRQERAARIRKQNAAYRTAHQDDEDEAPDA